jgi:heme-degrading monooxygenase HmoA
MTVYTLGVWTVRPGEAEAFEAGWKELARRTKRDFPAATAVLLRDRDDPHRYISFGPWESDEEVARWRDSAAFRETVGAVRAVLEGFEPHTMDPAVVVD